MRPHQYLAIVLLPWLAACSQTKNDPQTNDLKAQESYQQAMAFLSSGLTEMAAAPKQ